MILVKPSFSIEDTVDGERILTAIERAGRTCYKSEDKVTEDSARKFVAMIIARGHETVIEHEKITVRVVCDRGVTHEMVRHRIASFSQESTRYCNYAGGHVTFVIPPWVNLEPRVFTTRVFPGQPFEPELVWLHCVSDAERHYKELCQAGWKPEQARSILPNSLKTEIAMTANLREWRHFFKLRTAPAAHPQMREIAVPMLAEFKTLIPVIFDDIHP